MRRRCFFFFYGTLTHDHDNPMTRMVLPFLEGGSRASVRGQLRAVRTVQGWYPVLCSGQGWVRGRVYRAGPHFTPRQLRRLDAYEAFDPRRPSRSEYLRRNVRVRVAGKFVLCAQAYCYNRPAHAGLRVIANGDFATFIVRHALHAFASNAAADRPRSPE